MTQETPVLIYIAGPFRGKTPLDVRRNIERARDVGLMVAKAGGYPMIPHTMTAEFDKQLTDAFWLDGTMEMLRRCDGIVALPSWEVSSGARAELGWAREVGMPNCVLDYGDALQLEEFIVGIKTVLQDRRAYYAGENPTVTSQLRLVDSPAPAPVAYTTVLADPAWRFGDLLRQSKVKRSSVDQYELTMSVEEICNLGRPPTIQHGSLIAGIPTAPVGFLALWAPAAFVLDGSAAAVAHAWGYEPKQIIPWIKGRPRLKLATDGAPNVYDVDIMVQMGMGRIFRGCSEFLIICARGDGYTKLVKHKGTNGLIFEDDEIIIAPRPTSATRGVEHSTKPREQYGLIERVLPGPYLELFACEKREGWTSVGSVFGQLMTPTGVVDYVGEGGALPDPGLDWDF